MSDAPLFGFVIGQPVRFGTLIAHVRGPAPADWEKRLLEIEFEGNPLYINPDELQAVQEGKAPEYKAKPDILAPFRRVVQELDKTGFPDAGAILRASLDWVVRDEHAEQPFTAGDMRALVRALPYPLRSPDPGCLHCLLGPIVTLFRSDNPKKPGPDLFIEIAQVAGELIGSGLHNARRRADLDACIALASHTMRSSARELWDLLDAGGPVNRNQ